MKLLGMASDNSNLNTKAVNLEKELRKSQEICEALKSENQELRTAITGMTEGIKQVKKKPEYLLEEVETERDKYRLQRDVARRTVAERNEEIRVLNRQVCTICNVYVYINLC